MAEARPLAACPGGGSWSVEGIVPPAGPGCARWPEELRLLNLASGELVRGRCRATNLCGYCARVAAVETCEVLWLDACEQGSPGLWLLLTTAEPVWDGERWKRSMEHVTRAVRRRWSGFEYASLVEFTTGYGPRSGGLRRPHLNVFVRGVPVEDADELHEVVADVWCPRMDAASEQQRVYRVREDRGGMRGLTRYLSLHFQKESQAPPIGWRGQRFRATRGYFLRSRAELRCEARRALRLRRLIRELGDADLAELRATAAEGEAWALRWVNPSTVGELRPAVRNA